MKNFVTINTKIKSFKSSIVVPGDKSISIRFVLLASQAIGKSNGYNLLESEDVVNSIKAMKALGVKIVKKKMFTKFTELVLMDLILKII